VSHRKRVPIAVIGAGATGLACAHELAPDYEVTVIHDRALLESTSAIATAIWHVYLVDPKDKRNLRWSATTLERLLEFTEVPEAAVELREGVELFRTSPEHLPPWSHLAPGFSPLAPTELERYRGRTWGYRITAPTVDMSRHLAWLRKRVAAKGAVFRHEHVDSLEDLSSEYRFVINCTGMRALDLVHDEELYPVRGQYVVLRPNAETPETYVGDDEHPDGMAYVIPRGGELMVGGTEEPGEWDLTFSADKSEMLARANEFWPQDLTKLEELRTVVGLRPCRRSRQVRFGIDGQREWLIHNYGHGGSGFSLAWGCAEDMKELLGEVLT